MVLCACSNGIVDFSQKLYVNLVENQNIALFNFLTYIFSTIVLFVFYLIFKRCEKDSSKIRKPKDIIKPIIVYINNRNYDAAVVLYQNMTNLLKENYALVDCEDVKDYDQSKGGHGRVYKKVNC